MSKLSNEKGLTFEIPLFFRIRLVRYGLGLQGIFSVRILVFSFYIAFCYGAGWLINPTSGKWYFGLTIHFMRRVIIGLELGLDLSVFLEWKTSQLIRGMSLAKREKLKKMLSSMFERINA